MSHVQHGLPNIDELEDEVEGTTEAIRLSSLEEARVAELPPLRIPRNGKSYSKDRLPRSKSSSSGSSKSRDVLHMSAVCDHDPDPDTDPLPSIKATTSNRDIAEEPSMAAPGSRVERDKSSTKPSLKGNLVIDSDGFGHRSITFRRQSLESGSTQCPLESGSGSATSGGSSTAQSLHHLGNRQSFAAYHKCRSRSISLPSSKVAPQIKEAFGFGETTLSERNLHRTHSGLGLVGSIVAEEEQYKSRILSLFEADISSKKIKTFYNGVVGILEDRQRQDKIIKEDKIFIIHPLSTFRLVWDTILLLGILIMMIILPMKLAFFKIFDNNEIARERVTWYPIIIFIDLIFFADVVLSFFTGTIEQQQNPPKINLDRKEIQMRYLKTWFIPDLLSSIPFDVIGSEVSGNTGKNELVLAAGASKALLAAKVLKMFSLIRVLRLGRLHFIMKRWVQIFELSPLFIKIFQLLGFFFMIAHWSACLQFFVVYLRDFPEKSWPVLINIQDASWTDQYIWSVFRSLSHMITIGYGRDPPQDSIEVMLIIPSMLIGAFFYMMIVSQMTKTISMFKMGFIRYTEKLKDVDELAQKYNMSGDIHQRMHEFYHHRYGGAIHDDDLIIQELPLALKIDVIKSKYAEMLDNVFFLRTACDGFLEQFILSTKSSVFMTGDIVVRSEDIIENLYVITKGTVSIEFTTPNNTLQDEIIVRTYGFFGETPMLLKKKADMMVYAETPCDFLMIPKFIFYSLIDRFPLFKNQMLLVAHSRISLQGIDPVQHAPFLRNAFEEACCDKMAVQSSEDVLELASQARLDPARMEEFRSRNSVNYSVFRKLEARKKGEMPPSKQTPIDPLKKYYDVTKDQSIHVSLSFRNDEVVSIH